MERTNDSLFRNPLFLKLWVGQVISFAGDAISLVATMILVVQVAGSASAVGGILLARLLPTLASPLVGVLADRLDRRDYSSGERPGPRSADGRGSFC